MNVSGKNPENKLNFRVPKLPLPEIRPKARVPHAEFFIQFEKQKLTGNASSCRSSISYFI